MDGRKNLLSTIWYGIAKVLIDLPARRMGVDRLISRLEKSGQALERRVTSTRGRFSNQEALAHIIGIERWGQRRIKVALGEALPDEEYDGYRPRSQEWQSLVATFRSTRQETIGLSKSLRMAGVDLLSRVPHNQFGEISLLGWIFYLYLHASIESLRIS